MSHELQVITDSEILSDELEAWRQDPKTANALLVELGGGLLRFAGMTFPGAEIDMVYAQKFEREPEGTGPHFDLHSNLVESDYPWIGVYNLSGINNLQAVRLPDDLAKSYAEAFPEPDETAFAARRHFGAIALGSPKLDVATGTFKPGMGLVLSQSEHGPQIVHEITPVNSSDPGEFVKVTVPASGAIEQITDFNYVSLDKLVTDGLIGAAQEAGSLTRLVRHIDQPIHLAERPPSRSGLLD